MRKALGYLKPFWLSVLAVIALVFGQVQFELALPDYMSKIVTYGIQYGGITSPVPDVMREETYELMRTLMTEEQKATADQCYTLTDHYPGTDGQTVYVRNETESDSLEDAAARAFLIVSAVRASGSEEMLQMLKEGRAEEVQAMVSAGMQDYTEENLQAAEIMMVRSEYAALGIDTEKMQNEFILREGMMMILIALMGSLCAGASAFLAARTATGACRNMRSDVFKRVESFSSEEFSRFSTASLITRTTNDIQQVQMVLTMLLRIVLFAPFMGLTSLFKVMRYSSLAAILGWAVIFMIILMIITFYFTMPRFKLAQKLVDRLNLVTREQLSGMLVIRAFNNQDMEEKRFDEVNTDMTKLNTFLNRVMAVISPVMQFMMSAVSVLIIWIGANQIDIGAMQIGDMMAFLQYSTHVLISFMIVAMIFIMIPRSAVSANRIFEVLDTEPVIRDPKNPKKLPPENQPVIFDHVSFRYPGAEQNVLEDITFTASPGETVAMIGSTGSGKSTLINLLPRFFDVTEGAVRLGDTDIRDVTQKDLRDRIGYVPQKGILFSGTIESNLKYADENASEEKMQEALRVSQAKEFVDRMPDGIREEVSEGGTNFSGGQKQRLSIARALTKNAQIFIFDDTFSALDYQTDARLRKELNQLVRKTKATVLIVAQRISTIMHADQILVLDEGRIVGRGKHEDLMRDCSVYKEIAYSQLSEEEIRAYGGEGL